MIKQEELQKSLDAARQALKRAIKGKYASPNDLTKKTIPLNQEIARLEKQIKETK